MPGLARGAYRFEMRSLLRASTLTPGTHVPTDADRTGDHAAVLAGGRPVALCGPAGDPASRAQAERLARSGHAGLVFRACGLLSAGAVRGGEIAWPVTGGVSAIVAKPAGAVEHGRGRGPLVAIVLDDPHSAIATALCVTTETARALDPDAPAALDDGWTLPTLARARHGTPPRPVP